MHQEIDNNGIKESCSICYSDYVRPLEEKIRPQEICYECWHSHITTMITKISYKVGTDLMSPYEGGGDIDICMALNSLKEEHRNQLEAWLFKKYTSFTPDIEKCPEETCEFVFTSEKCRWGPKEDFKCPKCEIPLLVSRKTGFRSLIGYIYFFLFVNKCPKCKVPIQRISGCPHMTCPCGHQFCWYCLKDYRHNRDRINSVHQPRQCAIMMACKVLFLVISVFGIVLMSLGSETIQALLQTLSTIFSIVLRMAILDVFIAVQFVTTMIVVSPRGNPKKGFINSVNRKKYFFLQALLNIGFIFLLYLFGEHWTFLKILAGQLCLVGIGVGSILLVMYSAITWFQYIA